MRSLADILKLLTSPWLNPRVLHECVTLSVLMNKANSVALRLSMVGVAIVTLAGLSLSLSSCRF
jgi:hypothetical protein